MVPASCVTSVVATSIGRPYWETREIRVAAVIYLVLAVIALLVAVSIRLSLRRFRDVAAEIGVAPLEDDAHPAAGDLAEDLVPPRSAGGQGLLPGPDHR